jgi:hypothetical protein
MRCAVTRRLLKEFSAWWSEKNRRGQETLADQGSLFGELSEKANN